MDYLPTELVAYLCRVLTVSSLKSFRLTCRSFANIGEDALFHNFEFGLVPNTHRLYQLEQLAANAKIAARLQTLTLISGVQLEYADFRYWQANVYQDKKNEWERTFVSRAASSGDYEGFHRSLHARFSVGMAHRYDLFRWHLDQQASLLAEMSTRERLLRIMNQLAASNKYINLRLVMAEPEITLTELEAFDPEEYSMKWLPDVEPRMRVRQRRKNCLQHFLNFLAAAHMSSLEPRRLTAVDIPRQLLSYERTAGSDILTMICQDLQFIDFKIGSLPHSDWLARGDREMIYVGGRDSGARSLARLLHAPTHMETLSLEFPVSKESEWSFDIFDQTNLDKFPRTWLPRLRDLSLSRFRCAWEDLQALLLEARSLKHLNLTCCRLETGSMINLIEFMPSLCLESIAFSGSWYVDEDSGEWHFHDETNFTNCYAATTYEGPYAVSGLRSKVEEFMRHGGECPLPQWTPTGREEEIWESCGDTSWHYLPGLPRH